VAAYFPKVQIKTFFFISERRELIKTKIASRKDAKNAKIFGQSWPEAVIPIEVRPVLSLIGCAKYLAFFA
jgi:hypothetical protein